MRVMLGSFEEWYASQFHYKKIDGPASGQKYSDTLSASEVGAVLGMGGGRLYKFLKTEPFHIIWVDGHPRIDKEILDTSAAAKKRKAEVKHQQDTNTFIAPSALTLADLLDQYVTIYGVNTWAPSTYEGRKSLIDNYIRPLIGDKKLDDINPRMMDNFYRQLKTVRAKARPCSIAKDSFITPRTIREIHKLLRNAFNQAVKWELMARNPAQNATLPKCEEHEREIWNAETLFKAIDLCDRVVFHSIRHTSTTYNLMLSGGDIKGVQGDTGHAQASMVTERYAHILDDNRRINAERFQQQFYSGPVSEEPAKQPDPIQELDAGGKQTLLLNSLLNPLRGQPC